MAPSPVSNLCDSYLRCWFWNVSSFLSLVEETGAVVHGLPIVGLFDRGQEKRLNEQEAEINLEVSLLDTYFQPWLDYLEMEFYDVVKKYGTSGFGMRHREDCRRIIRLKVLTETNLQAIGALSVLEYHQTTSSVTTRLTYLVGNRAVCAFPKLTLKRRAALYIPLPDHFPSQFAKDLRDGQDQVRKDCKYKIEQPSFHELNNGEFSRRVNFEDEHSSIIRWDHDGFTY